VPFIVSWDHTGCSYFEFTAAFRFIVAVKHLGAKILLLLPFIYSQVNKCPFKNGFYGQSLLKNRKIQLFYLARNTPPKSHVHVPHPSADYSKTSVYRLVGSTP
jgi:hypothetical protein